MITAIVLYDLPAAIDAVACRSHFEEIAPGFLAVPGLVRKQFIHAVESGVAGGSYLWESRAAAEAFYSGPWREGIVARYGGGTADHVLRDVCDRGCGGGDGRDRPLIGASALARVRAWIAVGSGPRS